MCGPHEGPVTLFGTQQTMARSDELKHLFAQPHTSVHRRFEVCRAYFLEQQTAQVIADRMGLHAGTIQAVVRDFAANPDLAQFFVLTRPGRKTSPKRQAVRQRAEQLRRGHKSLGQIQKQLYQEGQEVSESYLATILREAGFSRLSHARVQPHSGERPGTVRKCRRRPM